MNVNLTAKLSEAIPKHIECLEVLKSMRKRLQLTSFPLDIGKFLRTLILKNIYGQSILSVIKAHFMLPISFCTPRKHQQIRA